MKKFKVVFTTYNAEYAEFTTAKDKWEIILELKNIDSWFVCTDQDSNTVMLNKDTVLEILIEEVGETE